jgi:hypothetical protein
VVLPGFPKTLEGSRFTVDGDGLGVIILKKFETYKPRPGSSRLEIGAIV